jgi:chromosome segregation ATPase
MAAMDLGTTKNYTETVANGQSIAGLRDDITTLSEAVVQRFERVDAQIRGLRGDMTAHSAAIDDRLSSIDQRLDSIGQRIDNLDAKLDTLIAEIRTARHT